MFLFLYCNMIYQKLNAFRERHKLLSKKLLYSKKNMRLNKFAKKCNKIKKKKEKTESVKVFN